MGRQRRKHDALKKEKEKEKERERGRERREEEEEKEEEEFEARMSERTGSSVLTSYPNQTLKPIGARRIGGGELERDASAREHVHRQRENRKRLLSVLKSSKANVRATKLRDEIALLETLCKNSKSQHRRSKLFQSLRRVVKECTFLLKTVN